MNCPVCKCKLRQGQNEIDGPGGPIPTDYYIFCPSCKWEITGEKNIIEKVINNGTN